MQLTAFANALAESFVDSYKTELIADRVWRSRSQLELQTVQWVAWFNHQRLHEALADIPPVEFEAIHQTRQTSFSGNGSVTARSPKGLDALTEHQLELVGAENLLDERLLAQAAPQVIG